MLEWAMNRNGFGGQLIYTSVASGYLYIVEQHWAHPDQYDVSVMLYPGTVLVGARIHFDDTEALETAKTWCEMHHNLNGV